MARKRPTEVSLVGGASLLLGLAWLLFLALGRCGDLLEMLQAGTGDRVAALRLGQKGLAGAGVVYATVLTVLLELTVALILVVAGVALLLVLPFARRAAQFGCAAAAAVLSVDTLLRVSVLAAPGQPVKVAHLVVNCLVTLGALALWGALFLPALDAAYAGRAGEAPAAGTTTGG
jgi:hypothetical protein